MLNAMQTFITFINGYLWGPPMIILLFGTHLFMTVWARPSPWAAPALYCGAGSPAFSALPPSMQNPSLQ